MRPLLALLALVPALAAAHELWLEPAGEGYALRHGHRGGTLLPLEPAQVRSLRCVAAGGAVRDLRGEAVFAAREAKIRARCAAVTAALDNGFWSLTPDGERHLPRTRVPDAVRSWESRRFAKWVSGRAPEPLGDELELVPVGDVARARVGSELAVRVLLDGRPAAGVPVTVEHRKLGETGPDGVVRVPLRSAGVQGIAATARRPLGAPEAETLVLEATLTFEVAP